MIITEENYLAHYGTLRKSGRYPWGTGDTQSSRNASFLEITERMRKEGMTESAIAKGFDMTTTDLRALRTISSNQQKKERIDTAAKLKAKGMSNVAIGQQMGINESSVRSLLDPTQKEKADILKTTSDMLKRQVDEKGFIDIGAGVENHLGISNDKLRTAVAILKQDGYEVHSVQVPQLTGGPNKTTVKVLAKPGTTYRDTVANRDNIRQISEFSDDGGRTLTPVLPPKSIDSKRVGIKYKEEGGDQEDGVIYVRPGVDDISIGSNRYAQVRIAVDGTHYLKGMAVYKDNLPDGVDLQFNTNKSKTNSKLDVMKKMKRKNELDEEDIDEENPFGSIVRQRTIRDANGVLRVTSVMNIVGQKDGSGEEGGWDLWSKSLSTQLLSKQSPKLAKQQLDETFARKKGELEDILKLTNPTVKKELLEKFADGADSSSVHLKAAALPRQATKVLLPINSLKDTEVYAPTFRNGEQVALIRYPHGGTFEIPVLTVNNGNRSARTLIGKNARDAIGINHKVAQRLSGADFDGDTVVVIPNGNGQIKSTPALKALKDFDVQAYKLPKDSPQVSSRTKGMQMGLVSNLITDMTIKGASPDELARAVKHSMVVIDAEKHHLDWKRSARDNGIKSLNLKYQTRSQGGASTIISRATSKKEVPLFKERSPKDGGPIDAKTGKKVFRDTPESFVTRDGTVVIKRERVDKLAAAKNAFDLVDDPQNQIERVYAEHSNRLKALADTARRDMLGTKTIPYSPLAKKTYASEVASLNSKFNLARMNKPLERQAQIFANASIKAKMEANPNLEAPLLKKMKAKALDDARKRVSAERKLIVPTPQEWAAIQAGAVSNHRLSEILKASDLDAIKALATPRTPTGMSTSQSTRARTMLDKGHTQADVADALGVSVSTLNKSLYE